MTTPIRQKTRLWLSALSAILALVAMIGLLAYRTSTTQRFREQSYQNCRAIEGLKMTFRLFIEEILKPQPGEKVTAREQAGIDRIEAITKRRFKPVDCAKP